MIKPPPSYLKSYLLQATQNIQPRSAKASSDYTNHFNDQYDSQADDHKGIKQHNSTIQNLQFQTESDEG